MGKQIKIPEHMMPEYVFLYEDFMGAYHILTRKDVQQIDISGDTIGISYRTSYPEFLSYMLPYKIRSGQSLFFQKSSRTENVTFRSGPDAYRPQKVKTVYDPRGIAKGPYDPARYFTPPGAPKYVQKNVSAPIVAINNEILIFDFFDNHIETFDSTGLSRRVIPIDFHLKAYSFFFSLLTDTDLNQKEFKQEILLDKITGKLYALFHQIGKRAILKEINPEDGEIVKEIEIPEYPNIDKIKVHNSTIFFTYQMKTYPFYTNLYRMKI